ncbi:MAG TPA: redoxin domain-containing protein [Chitinophagaceae bacterium]
MKKILFNVLPVAAIAVMALRPVGDPLPIGSPIPNPEIKMKDISGADVSFKDVQKKNGLLVMFSCNTCPVVKRYQSRTLEVCKYAIGNDIGVVLLNSNEATRDDGDSYNDMKEYAKEQGYYFNYVVDKNSTMADAFGANRTPECFLFDGSGKLVYHGAIDDNSNGPDQVTRKHAIVAIDEMISGKDISQKETRSVGCTIKRRS